MRGQILGSNLEALVLSIMMQNITYLMCINFTFIHKKNQKKLYLFRCHKIWILLKDTFLNMHLL